MKLKYGSGGNSLTLSGDLAASIEKALKNAVPKAVKLLEDGTTELEAGAVAGWPVGRDRRGRKHSRDLFEASIRLPDLETVDGVVENKAPYAFFIKSGQRGLGFKSASVVLLRRPAKKVAENIAKELAKGVGADIGGHR